jgi:hypothetical protein
MVEAAFAAAIFIGEIATAMGGIGERSSPVDGVV